MMALHVAELRRRAVETGLFELEDLAGVADELADEPCDARLVSLVESMGIARPPWVAGR